MILYYIPGHTWRILVLVSVWLSDSASWLSVVPSWKSGYSLVTLAWVQPEVRLGYISLPRTLLRYRRKPDQTFREPAEYLDFPTRILTNTTRARHFTLCLLLSGSSEMSQARHGTRHAYPGNYDRSEDHRCICCRLLPLNRRASFIVEEKKFGVWRWLLLLRVVLVHSSVLYTSWRITTMVAGLFKFS